MDTEQKRHLEKIERLNARVHGDAITGNMMRLGEDKWATPPMCLNVTRNNQQIASLEEEVGELKRDLDECEQRCAGVEERNSILETDLREKEVRRASLNVPLVIACFLFVEF